MQMRKRQTPVSYTHLALYIQRRFCCDAKSAALPDGVVDDAAVTSENVPLLVHKIPLWVSLARRALDERGVVAVGDKADVLTVGLAGVEKAQFFGDAARVALCKRCV